MSALSCPECGIELGVDVHDCDACGWEDPARCSHGVLLVWRCTACEDEAMNEAARDAADDKADRQLDEAAFENLFA